MFSLVLFAQVRICVNEADMMTGCGYDQGETRDTVLSGSLRLKIEVDDFAFMFGHKSI
jgi:hypothetical protein